MSKAWDGIIVPPVGGRSEKMRDIGLTMVIDKILSLRGVKDLVQVAGDYIDIVKLTFGTSAFYSDGLLAEKNHILTCNSIGVMPGGTFLETAFWQGAVDKYLKRAKELGFSHIEVSDGTIEIKPEERVNIIKKARDLGFMVITEVDKKDPKEAISTQQMHDMIGSDLEAGAFMVIIEAREAGKGVGIMDKKGNIRKDKHDDIVSGVDNPLKLMWEAPIKNQQQDLILEHGINVSLGNIPPGDVLALEALRQGLRGDTLKKAYLENKNWEGK